MDGIDLAAQRRHLRRNRLQGLLLLGGMVALLAACAWLIAGTTGVIVVGVGGGLALVVRPRVPADWVLRAYGAHRLPAPAAPELHRVVAVLAQRAGLPRPPQLYYVPSRVLNAFAVGRREDAALGLTDGLLRRLTPREVTAVLAHEVSHIRSDDLWVMTLADTIGRFTHALAYVGVVLALLSMPLLATGTAWPLLLAFLLTVVPTVVTLLQLALSRSREYDADLEAARLTGDPAGLASALQRLEQHEGRIWERILVPHRRAPDPLLLRTHPPTQERVRRLRALVPRDADRLRLGGPLRPLVDHPRVTRPSRLHFPGVRW